MALVDQRVLPLREEYQVCRSYQEVAEAIRSMVVRGAPAIGVAAAMGIALGVSQSRASGSDDLRLEFVQICDTLADTRPTAVNLFWAIARMREAFEQLLTQGTELDAIRTGLIAEAQNILDEDIAANMAMGDRKSVV